MATKNKFATILHCKCPRCREGKMFKNRLLSKNFMAMYTHCPKCGLEYEVQPSFFQGAMYVSYAFSVAIFITVFVVTTVLLNKPPIHIYMINITVATLVFIPFSFRYSRSIFLHIFGGVKYEPNVKLN